MLIRARNLYLFSISSFALFLAENAWADNVIQNGTGNIEKDKVITDWVSLLNWGLTAGGGVFAAVLGFGSLKHIKHGEYSSGISGLTAAALAGGITYFVHTYLAK